MKKKTAKLGMAAVSLLLSLTMLLAACGKTPDTSGSSGGSSVPNPSGDQSIVPPDPSGDNSGTDPSGDTSADPTGTGNNAGGNNSGGNTSGGKNNSGSSSGNNSGSSGNVVKASFTRNADGTCTDRQSGVIFLDDDLDDWKKTFERGTELQFDGNQAEFFNGDASRVIKTTTEAKDSWFTYKLDSGITEVGIVAYVTTEKINNKVTDGFDVLVSKDNKTWTTLTAKKDADVDMGSGWYIRTYRYTGIDKANKYLKIKFKKAANKEDPSYNPNIGRLRINNIGKMNDPDRFLEDRASATFYVDPKNGKDSNDGMSEAKAFKTLSKVSKKYFQPGDKILFKSGASFNGSVTIKGYGEAKNRVTVGTYGGSAKAKISARGGTAVTIKCDYITVENLEVTNPNGLQGIAITPTHTGVNKGVIIQNNYVHDVQTSAADFQYKNGGIVASTGGSAPTWFEGLLIQNNTVKNTARTGIFCATSWADRYGFGWGQSSSMYKNDNDGWWPYEGLKITGNTVDGPQGDGILVIGGRDTVIERNVMYNAFSTKQSFKDQTACAGLWTINTNKTTVQYNEVGYTKLPITQNGADGEGFDIDCAENGTTVQYNYSHNNEGGFLLMCDTADGHKVSKDHTVRFNLSVNDATRKSGQAVLMTTNVTAKTEIYNNTFIIPDDGRVLLNAFGKSVENITFTNNIISGNAKITAATGKGNEGYKNIKFVNNVLTGGAKETTIDGVTFSGTKTNDPKFKNASCTDYKDRAKMIAAFTPTAKIDGASNIANNGGKDINGSTFSAPFYGAVKY